MGMRLMVPLALCCAAVSSSSLAMQFMGGMDGLGDLFDKLTTVEEVPAEGKMCGMICGDCTQERFDELAVEYPEEKASNWKAMCENNKSEYVGNNQQWKIMTSSEKVGTGCCG
tara:strand:- start:15 stop:353 length:339 start_codon:yes stop_codon:yes gene_type:complete